MIGVTCYISLFFSPFFVFPSHAQHSVTKARPAFAKAIPFQPLEKLIERSAIKNQLDIQIVKYFLFVSFFYYYKRSICVHSLGKKKTLHFRCTCLLSSQMAIMSFYCKHCSIRSYLSKSLTLMRSCSNGKNGRNI